jgi:hypothetical protein
VSAAEEFVCWLAGAVGGKVKISGVFSDLKMSVCEVFKQEIVEIVAWCSSKRLWR